MSLSNYAEQKYSEKLFGNTDDPNFPPSIYYITVFVGSTSVSDSDIENDNFTEPDDPSIGQSPWTRLEIENNSTNFIYDNTIKAIKNTKILLFEFATVDWGSVVAIAAFDQPTGGNCIWYQNLKASVNINSGQAFLMLENDLELTFD
jgi:hypothetical protein